MAKAKATDFEIPLTMQERMDQWPMSDAGPNEPVFPVDSPKYYDKEFNEKMHKKYMWAAPLDPRFPQMNQTRHCFTYYVDYHRCLELLGEDYKPCKYLKNVYSDICPRHWLRKWDEWIEDGKFPVRFDR